MQHIAGFMSRKPAPAVRVQRNGNSKVLPLPAELARLIHADFGAVYTVEVAGDDVIYHRRTTHQVSIQGTGQERYGIINEADVMPAPQRTSLPALDWDF